jgi:hypothetical protein
MSPANREGLYMSTDRTPRRPGPATPTSHWLGPQPNSHARPRDDCPTDPRAGLALAPEPPPRSRPSCWGPDTDHAGKLTLGPCPYYRPPSVTPADDADSRWFRRYLGAINGRNAAVDDVDLLADELMAAYADRDATIAALTARVGALGALCAAGGVAAGVLFVLLVVRMIGGM